MSAGNSYNGWPANSDPNAIGIDKQFGKKVGAPPFGSGGYAGGMKSGDVSTLFIYLINRLHNEVEPMMNQGGNGYGCWGYSYRANVNNPSQLSCHASGTAIDYNAPKHPNGTSTGPNGGGGWSGSQYNKIQSILAGPLQGSVRWLTSNDPMHFEIYGNASKIASVAQSLGGSTTTPIPPDNGGFLGMSDAQINQMLEHLSEIRRMVGVLTGYPGGNEVENSVGVQVRGAGVGETVRLLGVLAGNPGNPGSIESSVGVQVAGAVTNTHLVENSGEVRRMLGVAIGYPPGSDTEHNLAQKQ